MWGQTKGNETSTTINLSQKNYFWKIQGYHYSFIPSMTKLTDLNPMENTDERMAKKLE